MRESSVQKSGYLKFNFEGDHEQPKKKHWFELSNYMLYHSAKKATVWNKLCEIIQCFIFIYHL